MALIKNLIKRLFLMDWDAPEKRLFRFFFYALAILLPMIWVGDCSFLQDQALLLNNAWADNQKGGITQYGLMGTRGLHYGPFATYFYRLILLISTDFKTIFLLKIFIFQSLLLAGVLWWRKLFKTFNFEYVLYCLFSPYILVYSRELWDNSWNLVFCLLCVAAYWQYLNEYRSRFLILCAIFASIIFQTHLMALPLLAALGIHFIYFERKSLLLRWKALSASFLTFALLGYPYLKYLIKSTHNSSARNWGLQSLEVTLLGSRFLTAIGFDYFLGKDWFKENSLTYIQILAICFTIWIVPYSLYSIAKAFFNLRAKDENHRLRVFAVLWFSLHCLLAFSAGLGHHPHYYNSVFWVFPIFLILMRQKEVPGLWLKVFERIGIVCLFIAIFTFATTLHRNHGNRDAHYGPTIDNLLDLSRRLSQFPLESKITGDVNHLEQHKVALQSMRKITKSHSLQLNSSSKTATIRLYYKILEDSQNGLIDFEVTDTN